MVMQTWDTETTVHTYNKRKASPFFEKNWVVVHAFKSKDEAAPHVHYFGRTRPADGWLIPVLQGCTLLVGANIKFDVLHAIYNQPKNLDAWMEYVAGGGQVWDVQLAEYLLEGMKQEAHMLALDEIAPRYGGEVKVDEVKVLWNAGVMTEDIEPALLKRYLAGGVNPEGKHDLGDIGNTEKIAIGQIARARQSGQLRSILLNMGGLLCTIEMERNGMFVDKPLALRLAQGLAEKVKELKLHLEGFLPEDLPFQFKWSSPFHKSALIFGGTVKWDGYEYDMAGGGTIFRHEYEKLAESARPRLLYAQKTVIGCWPNTEGMTEFQKLTLTKLAISKEGMILLDDAKAAGIPVHRYASGKNEGEPKTKQVKVDDTTRPKGRAARVPYTLDGYTKPKASWARSDYPDVYSTSAEVIEELGARNIPFLEVLATLQTVTKDLGTYYIVTDPVTGESTGMLTLVDPSGIIHHRINHTSTVTARFSSSDPNLQNIPKGSFDELTGKQKGSQIKRAFVSRFGADGKIVQSDFTALEVYVQAILTRCSQLIADLKAGLDMHCVRVAQKENMPYEEVLKLCKGYEGPDGVWVDAVPEWDKKRTEAKVFSFQRAYGAGAPKIASSTGMLLSDVEALIAAEEARYPEIDQFYAGLTKAVNASRKPGVVVPHPECPGIMCNLGVGHYVTPDGKLYSYRQSPAMEYQVKKGIYSSFSPTEIKNYVVQGGGGEWAKAAMWLAIRYFYKHKNWGGLALLVNQVHDAVYADCHNSVAMEAAAALHACMEAASELMEEYFQWEVPVPVPSDTTWGRSMMDEGRIEGLRELASKHREELRKLYLNGYKASFLE